MNASTQQGVKLAILFADITGFAEFADRNPPAEAVTLLDRILRGNANLSHGAFVEKDLH